MDWDLNYTEVYSCFLTVQQVTESRDISLIRLNFTNSTSEEFIPITKGDKITKGDITATYEDYSVDESMIKFAISDSQTSKVEHLTFSLKYWVSWIDFFIFRGHQNSGLYIFRPMTDEFKPEIYSHFRRGTISNGEQMDFYFENKNTEDLDIPQRAIVHVTIDADT